MKIEVIEKEKIKVTLSFADLMCFNIEPEKLHPNSAGLHKFLFQIMENVKKETGFNPYSGQVVVEAINSPNGITLYISKIKEMSKAEKKKELKKRLKKAKPVLKKTKDNENRYLFKKLDDFCSAVNMLEMDCFIKSSLYQYNNQWYFVYRDTKNFMKYHSILSEYCHKYGNMIHSRCFLDEHGKLVADGDSLVSMAMGIKGLSSIEAEDE